MCFSQQAYISFAMIKSLLDEKIKVLFKLELE